MLHLKVSKEKEEEVFKNYRRPSWKGPIATRPPPRPGWVPGPQMGPLACEQSKPGAGGWGRESSAETSPTQTELLPFVQAQCRL